jgi:hypothetical protein
MFASIIWRFCVAKSSKKYLFKKNRPSSRYRRKAGGVTTPANSREIFFHCKVQFCDPLEKFVAYVELRPLPLFGSGMPQRSSTRPVVKGRALVARARPLGGANVDDAFRNSIRNFALVILRCHRPRFLRAYCVALPYRAFAWRLRGQRLASAPPPCSGRRCRCGTPNQARTCGA